MNHDYIIRLLEAKRLGSSFILCNALLKMGTLYFFRFLTWQFFMIVVSIDQLSWFFRRGFHFVYDILNFARFFWTFFMFMMVMNLILMFVLIFHWCHWFFRQIVRCTVIFNNLIFDNPSRWGWLLRLTYHLCWWGFRNLEIQKGSLGLFVWTDTFLKEGSGYPIRDFASRPRTEQTFLHP